MHLLLFFALCLLSDVVVAHPADIELEERGAAGTLNGASLTSVVVSIPSPSATIVGIGSGNVETFAGIPYAEPPVGQHRLRPPRRLSRLFGTVNATGVATACPQMISNTTSPLALLALLSPDLATKLPSAYLSPAPESEDCLTLTVSRPAGTRANAKLPVLFWIHGGGFQFGSSSMYDGTSLLDYGNQVDKPFIYVAVNYRLAGFGFMPGREIMQDQAGNIGLLDQRLALEWIADNIAAFGGDPDRVTIWGESAGSFSVFDQLALFDGDNSYNKKPLFQGAIMNSGSVLPTESLDSPKAQAVYDKVVAEAGCKDSGDTLNCLREVDYRTFLAAVSSVPSISSYTSLALPYLPRPDNLTLTNSPHSLIPAGKYAAVPMIVGIQEDEGTVFAFSQANLTTSDALVEYLAKLYFQNATNHQIRTLVDTYGNGASAILQGSPFNTGLVNEIFPGYKQRAALLGDYVFTLTRRYFLDAANNTNPNVPSWSYMSSYDSGTPIFGTFHASDILQVFFGIGSEYAAQTVRSHYLNFLYSLDPNETLENRTLPAWEQWGENNKMAQFFANVTGVLDDDFRSQSYEVLRDNIDLFKF